EHVAEQIELAIGVGGRRPLTQSHQHARLSHEQRQCRASGSAEENNRSLAHHPRTFSPSLLAHHGPGSIGVPSLRNSTYSTGCLTLGAKIDATWDVVPMVATGSPV